MKQAREILGAKVWPLAASRMQRCGFAIDAPAFAKPQAADGACCDIIYFTTGFENTRSRRERFCLQRDGRLRLRGCSDVDLLSTPLHSQSRKRRMELAATKFYFTSKFETALHHPVRNALFVALKTTINKRDRVKRRKSARKKTELFLRIVMPARSTVSV